MLQKDKPDDYVLATGETFTVKEFINKSFSYKNIYLEWEGEKENEIAKDQNGIIRVKIDPKYYRPCEVDLLLGDPTKAIENIEWKREYDTLDKLIVDMFN